MIVGQCWSTYILMLRLDRSKFCCCFDIFRFDYRVLIKKQREWKLEMGRRQIVRAVIRFIILLWQLSIHSFINWFHFLQLEFEFGWLKVPTGMFLFT